jgi:hypothetical protein
VRANALRALASVDRWEALIAAVGSFTDPEPRLARPRAMILARWTTIPHSLFTSPSSDQRVRLVARLKACPEFPPDVRETIRGVLER